jgi:hypothetical protein
LFEPQWHAPNFEQRVRIVNPRSQRCQVIGWIGSTRLLQALEAFLVKHIGYAIRPPDPRSGRSPLAGCAACESRPTAML